jgi:stage V sporulation protein D (sporulation-specific penicillin-binding protein)
MKKNIRLGFIVILGIFFVLSLRFSYIQIFKAEELQKEVVEQRVKKIKELPIRGSILDSQGKTLAMSLNVKDIAIYPNLIRTTETRKNLAEYLSKELGKESKEILGYLNQKDEKGRLLQWVRVAKRVDPEIANELKESKYAQYIEISGSPRRYYPNGKLASNILGFVNHESLPGGGLELSLNHYLSGVSGYKIAEFDHMNKEIPIGLQTISKSIPGQQVQLTIDSYIQYTLDKTIEKAAIEMKAKEIHAIVMDPKTGKIVGMSSYPNFDPNVYEEFDPKNINRNVASYVYEPGSTFKPVYMAMALEGGYINKDTNYYDGSGHIVVNGTALKNWDSTGLGQTSLEDIIVNSSNVGMVNISKEMTSEQIVEGLEKSGYGQKTGIELPNEERGLFPSVNQLKADPLMKATISFGQGISVTPLQLATAFSEVINGGYRVKPTLIEKVIDEKDNVKYQWTEKERERIYSKETSELMKNYLRANMVKGSGKNVQIEGYDGGGKTGSAWKVENGVYKDGAIIGSFMGFLPYDDPKYVMLAVVDEPTGIEFGSLSGGPIFKEAMTEITRYVNVPKTVKKEIEKQKEMNIKNYKLTWFEDAKNELEKTYKNEIQVVKEGEGSIVVEQRYRYKNKKLYIYLLTESILGKNKTNIPSFEGKSIEDIDKLTNEKIKIEVIGKGRVVYQDVEMGQYDKKIETIKIWLK